MYCGRGTKRGGYKDKQDRAFFPKRSRGKEKVMEKTVCKVLPGIDVNVGSGHRVTGVLVIFLRVDQGQPGLPRAGESE